MAVERISQMSREGTERKLAELMLWHGKNPSDSVQEEIKQLRHRLQELDRNAKYERVNGG